MLCRVAITPPPFCGAAAPPGSAVAPFCSAFGAPSTDAAPFFSVAAVIFSGFAPFCSAVAPPSTDAAPFCTDGGAFCSAVAPFCSACRAFCRAAGAKSLETAPFCDKQRASWGLDWLVRAQATVYRTQATGYSCFPQFFKRLFRPNGRRNKKARPTFTLKASLAHPYVLLLL